EVLDVGDDPVPDRRDVMAHRVERRGGGVPDLRPGAVQEGGELGGRPGCVGVDPVPDLPDVGAEVAYDALQLSEVVDGVQHRGDDLRDPPDHYGDDIGELGEQRGHCGYELDLRGPAVGCELDQLGDQGGQRRQDRGDRLEDLHQGLGELADDGDHR